MGNSAHHLARQLSLLGYDSTVFTPDYGGSEQKESPSQENLSLEYLEPLFKSGNAAIMPQLFWKLKGYDVILLHYPFYGSMLPAVIAKLGRPKTKLFLYYHMDSIANGAKGLIFQVTTKLFLPVLIKLSDQVFCSTLDYARHSSLAKFENIWQDKFCELPFGFDEDAFAVTPLISKKDHVDLLFVGGLDTAHYFKGLPVLFRALSLLTRSGKFSKAIKLTIVGSGDLRPSYEQEAKKLGLENIVRFAGKVSDQELIAAYQQCDILVLPSINQGEAFGIVLVEAMAAGKPVIASNLPGVRSVFRDGQEGLLVEPGNADDLAQKISNLVNNDDLRSDMGKAARKLAWGKYAWKAIGLRLKTYLEKNRI